MDPMPPLGTRVSPARYIALILARALRSTVIISTVVLAVRTWGSGRWQPAEVVSIARNNLTFFILIFLALAVWEGWIRRARR